MEIDYSRAALLEVDIQNDFCPAYRGKNGDRPQGALAINGGNRIIGTLNRLAERIHARGGKILATQDWHPANHVSFAASHRGKNPGDVIILSVDETAFTAFTSRFPGLKDPIPEAIQQILWPVHCLQHSPGAAFHDDLNTDLIDSIFRKGYHRGIDSYSAFFENDRCTPTDLHGYLEKQGINTLIVGGLATDYCVLYSVVDSLRLGFKTFCVIDACAGINVPPGSLDRAAVIMKDRGAVFVSAKDF
ncbi:MAG: nicotinamidase [Treponema sp.]|jgi:nicotinamidase/pyrazinamidase|nr:nicotinamidase [Treponema sp.]